MTQLTNEDIKKIAKLACIEVNEDDCARLTVQVGGAISWIEQLSEVNTDNVEPLTNVHQSTLRLMPDIIADGDIADDILRNAKNAKYNYFSVPKVIE